MCHYILYRRRIETLSPFQKNFSHCMKFSTAKFYRPISLGFYFQQYLFKNVLAISTIIYRSDKWSHGKSKGLALAAEGR